MATPKHTPDIPKLSVVPTEGEPSAPDLAAPFLELEIRRGRTGYPTRPVCSRDFLIGSGPSSDLRLGGDDIPLAHTVLIVSENAVFAQWLCESPLLLVNGEPVHETTLCNGDRIGIGRFEFIVRGLLNRQASEESFSPATENVSTEARRETSDLLSLIGQAKAQEPAEDLAELSASALLERLEAEQNSVEDFEDAVRQAEAAILYAAAQEAENLLEESGPSNQPVGPAQFDETSEKAHSEPGEAEILSELEKVIQQLSGFSSELELRSRRIAAEEATQAEAADMLLDAQKELASQLERFHKQVSEGQEHTETKLRKAA